MQNAVQNSVQPAPTPVQAYTPVQIELDRPRTLFLSWAAIRRIREQTGVDFRDSDTFKQWDVEHLPVMLFEMLRHEADAPSLEEIESRILHIGNVTLVTTKIFECIGLDILALTEIAREAAHTGQDPLAVARKRVKQGSRRGRRSTS